MKHDDDKYLKRIRIVTAVVLVSVVIMFDVLLEVVCIRFSLLTYLIIAGIGYRLGGRIHTRLSRGGRLATFLRVIGSGTMCLGLVGAIILSQFQLPWTAKCSWRNCSRLLGPGLMRSPFPVRPATCSDWHRCANEARFSRRQLKQVSEALESQKCHPL